MEKLFNKKNDIDDNINNDKKDITNYLYKTKYINKIEEILVVEFWKNNPNYSRSKLNFIEML